MPRYRAIVAALGCLVTAVSFGQAAYNLHAFGGKITDSNGSHGIDGKWPWAGVTFDKAGNMYGTTSAGGPFDTPDGYDAGSILWEITAGRVYKDLHDFGGKLPNGDSDGWLVFAGVTFDADGNMFGTASEGGLHNGGVVWELTAGGTYKILHNFGGTITNANGATGPDGGYATGVVTIDSKGNLYGTAQAGGANNSGIVWKVTSTGVWEDLHDFGGMVTLANGYTGTDGRSPSGNVLIDGSSDLFGTTGYANNGWGNGGNLWEITPEGIYKDLHDFQGGLDDGNGPGAVTFDGYGNIYGTTFSGANIYAEEPGGTLWEYSEGGGFRILHKFAGTTTNANGKQGPDGYDVSCPVTIDKLGNLYGATQSGGANSTPSGPQPGMVWEYTAGGKYIDLFDFGGSMVTPSGTSVADVGISSAGVTLDPAGNLCGTEYGQSRYIDGGNSPGNVWTLAGVLQGVQVAPNPVPGGLPATLTVKLSGPAPIGGLVVSLASNNAVAKVLPTLNLPAGTTSGTRPVATSSVTKSTAATLTATFGAIGESAVLTVQPPVVSKCVINPTTVVGGTPSAGKVTLDAPAPAGGLSVKFSSSASSAHVPAAVEVPAGELSATFSVTTVAVADNVMATLKATTGTVSESADLLVEAPTLKSVSVSPATVTGGTSSTGTVTLTSAAPADTLVVPLSSNSSYAKLPAYARVAAGKTTATFTITTSKPSAQVKATITAKLGSETKTVTLSVKP